LLKDSLPELFSFSKDQDITIEEACMIAQDDIYDHFHLPLSIITNDQLNSLCEHLQLTSVAMEKDRWCMFGTDGRYSSRKVYKALSPSGPAHVPMLWSWKSWVQPKQKIFFWTLLQDMFNTRDML
jgi:hypothetical protein